MKRSSFAVIVAAAFAAAVPAPAARGAVPGHVVLEERLATALSAAPGDTVSIRLPGQAGPGLPFIVAGTRTPPPDPAGISRTSRSAWMPISDLERLSGRHDRVSRFVLKTGPHANVDSLVAALNATQLGFRAYRAQDVAARSSQTFVVISNFHKAISFLSILAGSAFLAAIVLLQVQELRKSLGVLRVIGFSKRRIYLSVVGETIVLADVGATIGIGLALLVSRAVNVYYRHYFDTDLVFSSVMPSHIGLAYGIATLVGWVVGSLATTYLFKLRVNEVLGR